MYHKGQSEWSIFDGRKNANFLPISKSKTSSIAMSNSDKETVKTLRGWAEAFFSEHSSTPALTQSRT